MYSPSSQESYRSASSGSGPILGMLVLVGVLAALVLAFPALLFGIMLQCLVQGRPWSTRLWLALTILSAILLFVLSMHGLAHLVLAQTNELAKNVRLYQANLTRWDIGTLWSLTWPLWMRSIVAVPIIALWRNLEEARRGDGEAVLQRQDIVRERTRMHAQKSAARRVRNPGRIPDSMNGHMVIGAAIADEDTS